ncbi:MAG TPA: phospho-sugar mutase, partial [Acidimicrobiales bacterium]
RWRALDPDEASRAALDVLVARAQSGDVAPLAAAFAGAVELGTAGLRAPMGPGPAHMNRVVIRRAAAALVSLLPEDSTVIVAHDARFGSRRFATDVARVVRGSGRRAVLLAGALPTPVLAFAVRHLRAAAGVAITASHNPAADNGFKVYLADGAQIGPPDEQLLADTLVAVAARHDDGDDAVIPWSEDVLVPDPAVTEDVVTAYVEVITTRLRSGPRDVALAYTALHGVGRAVTELAFASAGFAPLVEVPGQCDPDGAFPTVAFPNPEEAGALDRLVAVAVASGVDVGLAQDPDADRLAVVVPRETGWQSLTGDEVGVLLADHLLASTTGKRLVVRTIVSSRLLDAVAATHRVTSVATPTGFKHVMGAVRARPELRFVFGYEEAIGYAIGEEVRDKDGIAAALVMADLVARLRARGRTLDDRLDDLARAHGLHLTASRSHRFDPVSGAHQRAAAMAMLRSQPPTELAGRQVVEVVDHLEARPPDPPVDVVVLELEGGAWVALRPSGTEPKLKVYAEVVEPATDGDLTATRARAEGVLDELHRAIAERLGFPDPAAALS